MRCYLDASAAVKLVVREQETGALIRYLVEHDELETLSSVLLETELRRATTARGVSQELATRVLATIDLVEAPRAVFGEAGRLPIPGLRSLDAVHLATALRCEADVLIGYDRRLLDAAELVGISAVAPA